MTITGEARARLLKELSVGHDLEASAATAGVASKRSGVTTSFWPSALRPIG
jgi:hypothetical protein